MTINSRPFYWITCDWPNCGANAQDGSDYTAWGDISGALEAALDADWRRGEHEHYCPDHPVEWDSDHEDGEPYPDNPFLLMSEETGLVTLVNSEEDQ